MSFLLATSHMQNDYTEKVSWKYFWKAMKVRHNLWDCEVVVLTIYRKINRNE